MSQHRHRHPIPPLSCAKTTPNQSARPRSVATLSSRSSTLSSKSSTISSKSSRGGVDEGPMPAPYIVEDRRMLSRVRGDGIKIVTVVPDGDLTPGCCACCRAPDRCPSLSCLPCCDLPSYIVNQVRASRYIYVRENSLEWNEPRIRRAAGSCCGSSCCDLEVEDGAKVVYFDDSTFDVVRDSTRYCNEIKTFCFGGRGEKIEIESKFCLGACYRGRSPCLFVPACTPTICSSCARKHVVYVENAQAAVKIIVEARNDAQERMQIDRI